MRAGLYQNGQVYRLNNYGTRVYPDADGISFIKRVVDVFVFLFLRRHQVALKSWQPDYHGRWRWSPGERGGRDGRLVPERCRRQCLRPSCLPRRS